MNDLQADSHSIDAGAMLYGLLSLAFAYPGEELLDALASGELMAGVENAIGELGNPAAESAAAEFYRAAASCLRSQDRAALQSDYIALFELNPDQPPLHLNAHLYAQGKPDPVPIYQRLIENYRDFGIELRDEAGVERPDHLTVQLEFMAWLYQLLGQSLRGESTHPRADIETAIRTFRAELLWVGSWLAALEQRGGHPLYLPLGRLLMTLLEPD